MELYCHRGWMLTLRDVALEGTQVLAEHGFKLIQAEQRLAGKCFHEILVGIVGSGVIEEVLTKGWGQEVGKEGGLEDAALAHEDEDELVHYLGYQPRHHHRYQPFLEVVAEVCLGMLIIRLVGHLDAVG